MCGTRRNSGRGAKGESREIHKYLLVYQLTLCDQSRALGQRQKYCTKRGPANPTEQRLCQYISLMQSPTSELSDIFLESSFVAFEHVGFALVSSAPKTGTNPNEKQQIAICLRLCEALYAVNAAEFVNNTGDAISLMADEPTVQVKKAVFAGGNWQTQIWRPTVVCGCCSPLVHTVQVAEALLAKQRKII